MRLILRFVRDDGNSFILGGSYLDEASWGITKLEGVGMLQGEFTTESYADMDGSEITGERIPQRAVDVTANVKDARNNQIERRKVLSFFHPKRTYTMYVGRDGDIRWIVCKVEKLSCSEGAAGCMELEMALICPDPYFNSYDNYGKNIAAVIPLFHFPYEVEIGEELAAGIYNFAKEVVVDNSGDAETYALIVIEARGEVENPKVIQNDAYIRLLDKLASGDKVEIDLVENTIKKNGENCIRLVDRTSSFSGMVLGVGNNTISFGADNGDRNMNVVVYYNLRYLGA